MNQTNKSKIRCDNCGELNDDKSIYCKKCHAMLFRNIKCKKCGAENSAKNIYCDKCNHQLQPDPNIEKTKENNKNNLKIGIVVLSAVLIIFAIIMVANFLNSTKNDDVVSTAKTANTTASITTEVSTGTAGLTTSAFEEYFYNEVSDAKNINGSITDKGNYCLNISLNDKKSEQKNNYADFAVEVIDACNTFSNRYNSKIEVISIFFFIENDDYINWISFDGGNTGTLSEKLGTYTNEEELTFGELKRFYTGYKEADISKGLKKIHKDENVELYYYGIEQNSHNETDVIFVAENKYYEELEFQCKYLIIDGVKYDDIIMSDPVGSNSKKYINATINSKNVLSTSPSTISAEFTYFDKIVTGNIKEDFTIETQIIK